MTKDFKEQRRGDMRPSSRYQSSGRHGEERSPRPARPRLNRESVDRAWESGAPRNHADYRTTNGQPQRDYRRRNQFGGSPSAQNDRRPYSRQQNNFKRFDRTPNDNEDPRSRSFDSRTRHFDDRRSSDRRNYSDRPGTPYSRSQSGPGFKDSGDFRGQRAPYRDGDRYRSRGDERRDFDRSDRQQRDSTLSNRQSRDFQQPNRQHPRWRSRPMAQNEDQFHSRQDFNRRERFEGDYERFETPEALRPRRPISRSAKGDSNREREERHVTRLPDGRVLKGPRGVQRNKAQFWTGISGDVEALVEPIDTSVSENKDAVEDREPAVTSKSPGSAKGKAARSRKAKQDKAKPRSTGPKPSKRGFKWPTP